MTRQRKSLSTFLGFVVCIIAVTAFLWAPQSGRAAIGNDEGFIWIESWRHETSRSILDSSVSWTPHTSDTPIPVLAVVGDGRVTLYSLDEDGPKFIASIDDVPQLPISVEVTAVNPETIDVWVGTESPGIVYVFQVSLSSGRVQQRDRIRFIWDDVVEVIPFDLDGWGETDLALRTKNGNLALFRWTDSGYVEVPLGGSGREVTSVAVGPRRPEGGQDLVIARGRDHVVVLRWELTQEAIRSRERYQEVEQLMRIWAELELSQTPGAMLAPEPTGDGGDGYLTEAWENYVWGNHTRLFVGKFRENAQEQIAIFSAQNLIYLYEWDANLESITSVGSPLVWRVPQLPLIGVGNLSRQSTEQLIEITEDGIAAWQILPTVRQIQTLITPNPGVDAVFFGPDDSMIMIGSWGFSYFKARPTTYLRLLQKGRSVSLEFPAIRHEETIYLSSYDWRQIAGIKFNWNKENGRIMGIRGFRFFVGHETQKRWLVDGRTVELSHTPIIEDGILYLPISFGQALGASISWEPNSYTLIIER